MFFPIIIILAIIAVVGLAVGRPAGRSVATIAIGVIAAMIMLPIIVLGWLWWYLTSENEKHSYHPPPGTPISISFRYRVHVVVDASGQTSSGDATQTLSANADSNPTGLSDYMWKFEGEHLAVPAINLTIGDKMDEEMYAARRVIEACAGKGSYKTFAELAARLAAAQSCDEIEPRIFLTVTPYPNRRVDLPIDQRVILPGVRVTQLAVIPIGMTGSDKYAKPHQDPPPARPQPVQVAAPRHTNAAGYVTFGPD